MPNCLLCLVKLTCEINSGHIIKYKNVTKIATVPAKTANVLHLWPTSDLQGHNYTYITSTFRYLGKCEVLSH